MVVIVRELMERIAMSVPATARGRRISLGQLHLGQSKAHWALQPHRFKALRCGRRFGKTEFAKTWIAQGLVQGEECAWFAPQHMTWSEVYLDLAQMLRPNRGRMLEGASGDPSLEWRPHRLLVVGESNRRPRSAISTHCG
jgi:hypothetical protein